MDREDGECKADLLQRKTLATQVEAQVRGQILSGRLVPGAPLPSIAALSGQFRVSQAIVREALKSLQAKDLIELSNGRRARVKAVSDGVLVDFFSRFAGSGDDTVTIELLELRKSIEIEGARLAAERRSAEDLAQMQAILARMADTIGDAERFLDVDVELHVAIAAAARNRVILHLVTSIREVMRDTMYEGMRHRADAKGWAEIYASHIELVEAVAKGDAMVAHRVMRGHFDGAIREIVARGTE